MIAPARLRARCLAGDVVPAAPAHGIRWWTENYRTQRPPRAAPALSAGRGALLLLEMLGEPGSGQVRGIFRREWQSQVFSVPGSASVPLRARGATAYPLTELSLCLGVLFCSGCEKCGVAHADSRLSVGKRPPALVSQPGVALGMRRGVRGGVCGWVTCCGAAGERL